MGPKKPAAHDSHEDPVNPAEHWHVPEEVQMLEPAHVGKQEADSISVGAREPRVSDGS